MTQFLLENEHIKRIHCIGIGGIGVSALAEILVRRGYQVTGSDIARNNNIARLESLGVTVALNHQPINVTNADLVVYSSAIAQDNPEFMAAQGAALASYKRGYILAELMRSQVSIAVAGTHGKTTTSAMIAHTLLNCGVDPSFVIGGILNNMDSPAHLGAGNYFVAEADESDASLLYMSPHIAIVTNIDADHLATYDNDFTRLKQTFMEFLAKLPDSGTAILCLDDPHIRELIPTLRCRVITYGFAPQADFAVSCFAQKGLYSDFTVERPAGLSPLVVQLHAPGWHNVQNAVAAIVTGHLLNLPDDGVLAALKGFPGVGRRFQCHGKMALPHGHALIIEDYGHHPNEIKATLQAAQAAWPNQRIVLVFQPHRYTRTRDLMSDFSTVLGQADVLILLDVCAAGEEPIPGVNSAELARSIADSSGKEPPQLADLTGLPAMLRTTLRANDIVILQGAGSVGTLAATLTA